MGSLAEAGVGVGGTGARAEGVRLTVSGDGIRTEAAWSLSAQRVHSAPGGACPALGALAPSTGAELLRCGCQVAPQPWLGLRSPDLQVSKAAGAPALGQHVQRGSSHRHDLGLGDAAAGLAR